MLLWYISKTLLCCCSFYSLTLLYFIYLFVSSVFACITYSDLATSFSLQLSGVNFPVVSPDRVSWFAEVEQINPDILQPDCGCCGSCPRQDFFQFHPHQRWQWQMVLIEIAMHCTAPGNGNPIRINCSLVSILCLFACVPFSCNKRPN